MNTGLFYKDKPLFGLDLGSSSLKVMQINKQKKQQQIVGYGVAGFDPANIKEGIIVDPIALAKVTKNLFEKDIIGEVTTRRVALSVPVARTYNRVMTLPRMNRKDLDQAVLYGSGPIHSSGT